MYKRLYESRTASCASFHVKLEFPRFLTNHFTIELSLNLHNVYWGFGYKDQHHNDKQVHMWNNSYFYYNRDVMHNYCANRCFHYSN